MLMDLKALLLSRRCASLSEIAREFASDPEAVRAMLDRWVQKGKVRRGNTTRCRGCTACNPADLEFYQWVS